MRHRKVSTTFGRSTAHRKAMLASLVCSLIVEKRITTTLTKAKAMRQLAEKMVTLAKRGTLATRCRAVSVLHRKDVVKMLFSDIAPQCQDRNGGYTRIVKLAGCRSDGATLAIVEWISIRAVDKKKKPAAKDEKKNEPAASAAG